MDELTADPKQIGDLALTLPEGSRFPLITGPNGIRWTLSDSERSDSLAEVSALRISPDERRVAFIVARPNKTRMLREIELATGQATGIKASEVYDAVYLPDGRLLASVLENQQPRKAVILTGDLVEEVAKAKPDEFISLSVATPAAIKLRAWNGNESVVHVGNYQAVVSDEAPHKFGCPVLNDQLSKNTRCQQRWIRSSDGTSVPVSVVIPQSASLSSPIYLRAYGAYGQSVGNSLSRRERFLLNHGITVVFAHVRGGGELGTQWHAAGRGANRGSGVADLVEAIRSFRGRPIILSAASAGAIDAVASLVRVSDLLAGVILESPLLDLEATLRKFPDDQAEFGATPETLFPFEVIKRIKPPPMLVICSRRDPLVQASACSSFTAMLAAEQTSTWLTAGDRHAQAWSRANDLELDSRVLVWVFKRLATRAARQKHFTVN